MGCCQSENRLDDLGYIKADMIDKKLYYQKQQFTKLLYLINNKPKIILQKFKKHVDQAMLAQYQLQNMDLSFFLREKKPQYLPRQKNENQSNSNDRQQQDQMYQERNTMFRYSKKQLSEIREQDPQMEQSLHYDGSQTKSAKSNRLNDPFSEGPDTGFKEQSFYKSQYHHQVANVQPFKYSDQAISPNSNINLESPQANRKYMMMGAHDHQGFQLRNEEMFLQKQQIIQI